MAVAVAPTVATHCCPRLHAPIGVAHHVGTPVSSANQDPRSVLSHGCNSNPRSIRSRDGLERISRRLPPRTTTGSPHLLCGSSRLTITIMTAPMLPSPLALALFLLQDDSTASPSTLAGSPGSALVDMVHSSGIVAQVVLVILLLASLFSWSIMLSKWRAFSRARKEGQRFLRAFRKSGRLSEISSVAEQFQPSPLVPVFVEINDEYQRQSGGRGLPRNPQALERAALTA